MALLVSAGVLLLVAGTQASDSGRRRLERDTLVGGKLEGVWNVTVNVCNNGPTATRLNTFMFGGTMQEFTALVSPLLPVPRGPGHGVWEHSNGGNFSYTVKFFVFNADLALLRDGVSRCGMWSWTFQEAVIRPPGRLNSTMSSGNPVGPPVCATETATRF